MENKDLIELKECWEKSPYPTVKINSYFSVYASMFAHIRGTPCTFIETGILDGGSLFMWKAWLGKQARIVGIDLNPNAEQWRNHGFEIFIGDQGDPQFWKNTLKTIGRFDVLLDDGGHQSFQQIVTAYEAIRFSQNKCIVMIEDTATSFMRDFASHGRNSFLEFSKSATDVLIAKSVGIYRERFPTNLNEESVSMFNNVSYRVF